MTLQLIDLKAATGGGQRFFLCFFSADLSSLGSLGSLWAFFSLPSLCRLCPFFAEAGGDAAPACMDANQKLSRTAPRWKQHLNPPTEQWRPMDST